jgi:hypothetical protein
VSWAGDKWKQDVVDSWKKVKRDVIRKAEGEYLANLAEMFTNLSAAYRAAGVDRKHLRSRMRAHGLRDRPQGFGLPDRRPGGEAIDLARWGIATSQDLGSDCPIALRVVLDLCAGSGAWSEPYRRKGYRVVRVTLPDDDVRVFVPPPAEVWGVLAAPPCNEFSRARRTPGDHVVGMETVAACIRVVVQARPRWWALENPWHGDLARYLGPPDWTFNPWQFGDRWTKPTALWGEFTPPSSLVTTRPTGPMPSAMDRRNAAERAITPPGFAAAFCDANP